MESTVPSQAFSAKKVAWKAEMDFFSSSLCNNMYTVLKEVYPKIFRTHFFVNKTTSGLSINRKKKMFKNGFGCAKIFTSYETT